MFPGIGPLLPIAALVLVLVLGIALFVFAMQVRNAQRQQQENQASIQADMRALCNAAVQVGERVNRMEEELKQLQQRQQELGVRQEKMVTQEPQEASFDQAIKLARKGSSVEELMDVCGLSRGEAELITMMHRLDPNA